MPTLATVLQNMVVVSQLSTVVSTLHETKMMVQGFQLALIKELANFTFLHRTQQVCLEVVYR